jgi:2-polyprenyl-3-methyl-5-hydroxy-6-metoxy-1,4-benzoquinol methylase
MSEIADYYNDFSNRQIAAGINNRHLSIIQHLKEAGLNKSHRILEVGCGIGTVSELILRHLSKNGFLHSIDISPKSIAIAKARLKKYENALIETKDLTEELISDQFDIVVLPDVIEHIPLDLHVNLFRNILGILKPEGFVFIHIPHPNYLEWIANDSNEELQIIDQPILTEILCKSVYPLGYYIHFLKSYSIYTKSNDYQIVILKRKPSIQNQEKLEVIYLPPFHQRVLNKLRYLSRGLK